MKPISPALTLSLLFWALLVGVALVLRPLMPVDETRYLTVAWEMWRDGNFLVPHLNGETYSHKPPLLFWLMHLGWAVFGVSETWARLVAPLFALGTLLLTHRLALMLWPERPNIASLAPLLLMGTGFFAFYTTLTMFDMLLAFFSVLGLLGVVGAAKGKTTGAMVRGFGLLGLAIGLGVLAKGPAILLHLLPVTLLAPFWIQTEKPAPEQKGGGWLAWHGWTLGALVLGSAIALLWAIPAGIAGGPEYQNAIFWGQSAGRITGSFAHARPFWWYAAWLPAVCLPWVLWPPFWKAARNHTKGLLADKGARFLLIWFGVAFVAFSFISGKQFHYLLPELPALALLGAWLLAGEDEHRMKNRDLALPGVLVLGFGVLAAVILRPGVVSDRIPPATEPVWMILVAVFGGFLLLVSFASRYTTFRRTALLGFASLTLIGAVHLAARTELARAYDTGPLAKRLAALEQGGSPVAHYGKYMGQYNFTGRLMRPVTVLAPSPEAARAWAEAHPNGLILSYRRAPLKPGDLSAAAANGLWPFRGKTAIFWDSPAIIANPDRVLPK